jgi:hypothetical protein
LFEKAAAYSVWLRLLLSRLFRDDFHFGATDTVACTVYLEAQQRGFLNHLQGCGLLRVTPFSLALDPLSPGVAFQANKTQQWLGLLDDDRRSIQTIMR